jgi:hypothetical protein|tara:strand:+ start:336 stop:761 length:426 start_codon:yes stop_codon:yes gene_type:complete
MMNVHWSEVSDEVTKVYLVVAVADPQQVMLAWGAAIPVDLGKALQRDLLAGVLKNQSVQDAVQWMSVQVGLPLRRLRIPVCSTHLEFTTLRGVFLYAEPFVLPAYSQHGRFCETAFGELNQVFLDWLEAGTDVPFSVMFCW